MSSRRKLLDFLLQNVGVVLTSKELQAASGGAVEFARRLRELRAQGWKIETHRDDSSLRPGQWVLRSKKQGPPVSFGRGISRETRARVLERNGYTCQMCGVAAGDQHPHDGRRVTLHLGHIVDRSMGGTDTMDNLRALCSVCNEGAQNVTPMPPKQRELMTAVRRADMKTQRAILEWLSKRLKS